MNLDGVEPRDLVRWHGELRAAGWVELNVGQRGCGYRATAAGMRALKQVRQRQTVVDDEVPEVVVGNRSGPAPDSGTDDQPLGPRESRKSKPVRAQAVSV
jgi:hypothetical protein